MGKRVIVVVHGMGDQTKYASLQTLVKRFLDRESKPPGVPLGWLHSELEPAGAWAEIEGLSDTGFAEVFWADIGRDHEAYVLEDTVAWADSIVDRLRTIDARVDPVIEKARDHKDIDLPKVRRVLCDIANTIKFGRFLNRGLKKIGFGSIALDDLLARFLGDVQLFAEYAGPRDEIMKRFSETMERIEKEAEGQELSDLEIHICAHSWGTVVAFLALLEGRIKQPKWFARVKSFMTFGSPIDKLLVLWPRVIQERGWPRPGRTNPRSNIRWHNYADKGDPVGHKLDGASRFLKLISPGTFENDAPYERLFRRYVVPGKAHVDYWNDQALFDEWVEEGVEQTRVPETDKGVGGKTLARILSPMILYLVAPALCGLAAYCIGSALEKLTGTAYFDMTRIAALGGLIFGSVALAASARVTRKRFWVFVGLVLFAAGAYGALCAIPHPATKYAVIVLGLGALFQLVVDLTKGRQ